MLFSISQFHTINLIVFFLFDICFLIQIIVNFFSQCEKLFAEKIKKNPSKEKCIESIAFSFLWNFLSTLAIGTFCDWLFQLIRAQVSLMWNRIKFPHIYWCRVAQNCASIARRSRQRPTVTWTSNIRASSSTPTRLPRSSRSSWTAKMPNRLHATLVESKRNESPTLFLQHSILHSPGMKSLQSPLLYPTKTIKPRLTETLTAMSLGNPNRNLTIGTDGMHRFWHASTTKCVDFFT